MNEQKGLYPLEMFLLVLTKNLAVFGITKYIMSFVLGVECQCLIRHGKEFGNSIATSLTVD